MQVIWHGHSAVSLLGGGLNILIDPFFADGIVPEIAKQPDILLLTHDHGDHLGSAEAIMRGCAAKLGGVTDLVRWLKQAWQLGEDRFLNGGGWNIGGAVAWRGVTISMAPAVHSSPHGVPVGYVMSFPDGKRVYHAGDTALFGDMALLGDQFAPDLAMLPIGGVFTMDPQAAAKACALLRPKNVIPIHFGTFAELTPAPDVFVRELSAQAPKTKAILPKIGIAFEL